VVRLAEGRRVDEALFGEGGGRMMVTVRDDDAAAALMRMAPEDVLVRRIGTVGGDRVTVHVGDVEATLTLAEAGEAYERGLPEALA
jgi:thioester reductase-like protein